MWNYRIVRRKCSDGDKYGIHEVYYNEDGSIWAISEQPCMPFGETKKELLNDLSMMTASIIKPVLDYDMKFAPNMKLDERITEGG